MFRERPGGGVTGDVVLQERKPPPGCWGDIPRRDFNRSKSCTVTTDAYAGGSAAADLDAARRPLFPGGTQRVDRGALFPMNDLPRVELDSVLGVTTKIGTFFYLCIRTAEPPLSRKTHHSSASN